MVILIIAISKKDIILIIMFEIQALSYSSIAFIEPDISIMTIWRDRKIMK